MLPQVPDLAHDRVRAALEHICRMQGGAALRKRTKQVKVTRVFKDARAQRCEVLMHGGRKVERRAPGASV